MLGKRKTYYRINDEGKIESVRRTIPPEGWTTDKKSLQNTLLARKTLTDIITEKSDEVPEKQEKDILKKQVEELQQQVRTQELELKTLRERTVDDTKVIKRIKEERRDREIAALERTAEFAKSGFPEEEYYQLKNMVQGLRERVEAYKERYQELREENDRLHGEKVQILDKIENYNGALSLHQSALVRIVTSVKRNMNSVIESVEEQEQVRKKLKKRMDQISKRCEDARNRCGWKPSLGDPIVQ